MLAVNNLHLGMRSQVLQDGRPEEYFPDREPRVFRGLNMGKMLQMMRRISIVIPDFTGLPQCSVIRSACMLVLPDVNLPCETGNSQPKSCSGAPAPFQWYQTPGIPSNPPGKPTTQTVSIQGSAGCNFDLPAWHYSEYLSPLIAAGTRKICQI